jgi:predicted ChrR family anti-sigma factor
MTHHVPEEMLLEYVAGASTDGAALAIACHVALCDACAARVAELEALAGGFLAAGGDAPLAPGALEAVLARIDAPPQPRAEAQVVPTAPAFLAEYDLPRPLLRRLAEGSAGSDWRFVVPGVRAVDLPAGAPGVTVRFTITAGPSRSSSSRARSWRRASASNVATSRSGTRASSTSSASRRARPASRWSSTKASCSL